MKFIYVVFLSVFFCVSSVFAQEQSSANYLISTNVASLAKDRVGGSSVRLRGTEQKTEGDRFG